MSEFTLTRIETREPADEIGTALTLEVGLYAALALLAFFARFFILDAYPLNSDEARQALASWNFVRGNSGIETISPLLFTANALFFSLFGASDFVARLAPAFFGVALVLTPTFFRRDLGRTGALIASAFLAFSPSLVFFSRTLVGVIPAVTCTLAAVAFFTRYLESRCTRDLYWGTASAALALVSAPDVWTMTLALGIYVLALRFGRQTRLENQKSHDVVREWRPLLLFAVILVGVATTFLLHSEGLGASFDLFAAWLDSLRLGNSLGSVLRLLLVYEPLALFFGLAALYDLVLAPDKYRFPILGALGTWVVVGLLVLSFSADASPSRIVILVVPLALMAGSSIGAWLERLLAALQGTSVKDLLLHEVPILAVASGLMSFLAIVLAEFAQRGNILTADVLARFVPSPEQGSDVGGLVVVMLFVVAFIAASVLAVTTLGVWRAKNIGVLFALVILTMWTIRQMTMLNFPPGGGQSPEEWMVSRAAAPNVRDLVSDLQDASRWRANDTHTLAIAADSSLGPIVAWNLREFTNVRYSAHPTAAPDVQALLLSANSPAPSGSWISQRYQLELTRGDAPASAWRALIFRDVGSIGSMDAVLWIPSPQ